MMIKAVVFDLEGTLFTSRGLSEAHMLFIIKEISKKMRMQPIATFDLMEAKKKQLAQEFGFTPPMTVLVEYLGVRRQEFYNIISRINPSLFINNDVGVQKLLESLKVKGLKLGLLTNMERDYTKRILAAIGVDTKIFTCIVTGNEVAQVKPHIEPFLLVIKKLGIHPQHILMVGDRIHIDLLPAKSLGMKTALLCKHEVSTNICKGVVDVVLHNLLDLNGVLN